MNILNFIEAIDMDKSEYTYEEEFDAYFFLPHTTYFNEKMCQNFDFFRDIREIVPIYVSQKIKDIIEKEEWIGFDFFEQQMSQ